MKTTKKVIYYIAYLFIIVALAACSGGASPTQHSVNAYVVNAGSTSTDMDTVSKCSLNLDGTFGTCTAYPGLDSQGNNTFKSPLAIEFNKVGNIAYLANCNCYQDESGIGSISVCAINADGSFGTCSVSYGPSATESEVLFNNPTGVALNTAGNILYISNFDTPGYVAYCSVNQGSLSNCELATPTFSGMVTFGEASSITLSSFGGSTYAYVASNGFWFQKCIINSDGSFGNCVELKDSSFHAVQSVSFNSSGTFAYIGNAQSSTISICPVDSTGSFGSGSELSSSCQSNNGNGTFNFSGNAAINMYIANSMGLVYIPNDGSETISICAINSTTGNFSSCVTSGESMGFNFPSAVVLRCNSLSEIIFGENVGFKIGCGGWI